MHIPSKRIETRGLALVSLLLLGGCGGPEPVDAPAKRVILVVCDTLRPDRLETYGYQRPTSPSLDKFSEEAVVFLNTYACAPHTGPAMSSLFTGRMPDEIGVAKGNRRLMPPEIETLAERLADAGIPSAAVVSNWALRQASDPDIGVRQGFLHYDDEMNREEPNRPGHFERTAEPTTDRAIAWLEKAKRENVERFFLWVHYMDPHGPYTAPEAYTKAFVREPRDPRQLRVGKSHKGKGRIPNYQALGDERHIDVYKDNYDAEIRYLDDHVGRFLWWVRENGLYEDSLIIFTADHAESLGEHGYWFCHGESVYRDVVRVPLIVRFPGGDPGPGVKFQDGTYRVDGVTTHLDVWPTVLEAFGLDPGITRGVSLFTNRLPEDRVVAQSLGDKANTDRRWFALTDSRWRAIFRHNKTELYDVANDPFEEHDLAAREQRVIQGLQERYAASIEVVPLLQGIEGIDMEMDEESTDAMNKLGYGEAGDE